MARPVSFALLLTVLVGPWASPAIAQQRLLDTAMEQAVASFETAWPKLDATVFGVDTAAYRDALSLLRFESAHWGGEVIVKLVVNQQASGDCTRFAAYTRIPPENGSVQLVLCPQFFSPGADDLRVLTLLHEMVHVVAGTGECRAMAFAARIEKLARGSHTPVAAYWQANGCNGSAYRLP